MSVAFSWWLVMELLGLVGAPLAAAVFRNLPDSGWSLSKPLSLLALGWLIWAPLSVIQALPFNAAWIVGSFVAFALANLALLRVNAVRRALVSVFRSAWRYIVLSEGLFTAAFAAMLWERSFTPAVVDTEKFMDEAFLAAIWRAPHLPPPDPWLSGYSINYYYFGHYLMALPAKALGTQPAAAFNLAVGLTFALAFVTISGVATNLAASVRPAARRGLLALAPVGVISALLTLVSGNLAGAQVWLKQARLAAATDPSLGGNLWAWWTRRDLWLTYDWWSPSRVTPNTITEFPAFSFALADLHAHVLALPFTALAVGLALNLLRAHGRGIAAFGGRLWPLGLVVSAVILGGLYAINGWDLPAYVTVAVIALLMQQWLAHGRALTAESLLDAGAATIMLVALVFLLYAPFYLGFTSPAQGAGLVPPALRTPVGAVWSMYALPALLALSYLAWRLGPFAQEALSALLAVRLKDARGAALRRVTAIPASLLGALPLLVIVALTALTSGATGWTVFWAGMTVIICASLLLRDLVRVGTTTDRGGMMATLLVGCAAGLVGLCEVIYLRDVFGGSLFRMNTVFKFYYQAWLLLGIVSGPILYWLSASIAQSARELMTSVAAGRAAEESVSAQRLTPVGASGDQRRPALDQQPRNTRPDPGVSEVWARATSTAFAGVWSVTILLAILATTIYPIQAVAARTVNLSLSHSLDGAGYMAQDATDTGDEQAIAWLNAHVAGDAVIVEAAQYNEYTRLGRVSAFTGLPTLIGWGGHEAQWRYNWFQRPDRVNIIGERLDAVNQIYTNPDSAVVLSLLRRYHASFVYVGQAERSLYSAANLGRFASYLRIVYHDVNVTIYAVPSEPYAIQRTGRHLRSDT